MTLLRFEDRQLTHARHFQKMFVTCVWQREDNRLTRLQQISIGTLRLTHATVTVNRVDVCRGGTNVQRKKDLVVLGLQARGVPTVSSDRLCFDRTSTALAMRSLQGTFVFRTYSRNSSEGIPKRPKGP
jgi:hypothetical protein